MATESDNHNQVERILALADRLFRQLLPTIPRDLLSLDITVPQTKIMLILYVSGPKRMSDIASELDVTMPTATSLVDRLVEKHYVEREAHPDDRRVVLCQLSEEGQRAISHVWQTARRRSQELLQAMEGAKLEMLAEALQSMLQVALTEQQPTEQS